MSVLPAFVDRALGAAQRTVTPTLEGVGIALSALRGNKMRAALTILGVAIAASTAASPRSSRKAGRARST
jgi:hypothetical protein